MKEMIDPAIKKQINEEGFEDNAAVIIGKKEDMARELDKLEKEGKAADVGTYIKMHKEMYLPQAEMSDDLKKKLEDKKGGLHWTFLNGYEGHFIFVDKNNEVANVRIYFDKVASLNGYNKNDRNKTKDKIDRDLAELGFNTKLDSDISAQIFNENDKYKIKIKKQLEQEKKEKFDF